MALGLPLAPAPAMAPSPTPPPCTSCAKGCGFGHIAHFFLQPLIPRRGYGLTITACYAHWAYLSSVFRRFVGQQQSKATSQNRAESVDNVLICIHMHKPFCTLKIFPQLIVSTCFFTSNRYCARSAWCVRCIDESTRKNNRLRIVVRNTCEMCAKWLSQNANLDPHLDPFIPTHISVDAGHVSAFVAGQRLRIDALIVIQAER